MEGTVVKRSGIAHAELSRQIAMLGHTDRVVVGDMGLPLPRTLPVIDLALTPGTVPFLTVLDALTSELVVQKHVIARESLEGQAGGWFDERAELLGERSVVSHEELKALSATAIFAIRTGEATPYANVVLECGVPF